MSYKIYKILYKYFYRKYLETRPILKIIIKRRISISSDPVDYLNPCMIVIESPDVDRLLEMGFESVSRGYARQISKAKRLHVLPTGEGWKIHVDRVNRKNHHSVLKTRRAGEIITDFINEYELYN